MIVTGRAPHHGHDPRAVTAADALKKADADAVAAKAAADEVAAEVAAAAAAKKRAAHAARHQAYRESMKFRRRPKKVV